MLSTHYKVKNLFIDHSILCSMRMLRQIELLSDLDIVLHTMNDDEFAILAAMYGLATRHKSELSLRIRDFRARMLN